MEQFRTVGIVTCWAVHKYCRSVLKFYYQNRTPVIPLVAAGSARSCRRMQQQHRMAVVACQPTRAIWSMRVWHLGQGLCCSASSQAQLQQTQMCSLHDRVDGRGRATVMSDLPSGLDPRHQRLIAAKRAAQQCNQPGMPGRLTLSHASERHPAGRGSTAGMLPGAQPPQPAPRPQHGGGPGASQGHGAAPERPPWPAARAAPPAAAPGPSHAAAQGRLPPPAPAAAQRLQSRPVPAARSRSCTGRRRRWVSRLRQGGAEQGAVVVGGRCAAGDRPAGQHICGRCTVTVINYLPAAAMNLVQVSTHASYCCMLSWHCAKSSRLSSHSVLPAKLYGWPAWAG